MEQEQLKWLTDELIEIETRTEPRRRRSEEDFRKFQYAVSHICERALAVYAKSPFGTVRLSRDIQRYTNSRYGDKNLSYRPTIQQALPLLVAGHYITIERNGSYDRETQCGKQTEIKATKKLADLIGNDLIYEPQKLAQKQIPELIRIHGCEKKPVDYVDTFQTRVWRENLARINECIVREWSDLDLSDSEWMALQESIRSDPKYDYRTVDLSRQRLVRIFNSKQFDQGGRFYWGWWQNIPSKYRSRITINGQPTVELDYKQIHPTILYSMVGKPLDGDAYDIGLRPELRDLVKQAFNAMVHSKQTLKRPPRGLTWPEVKCITWRELVERILAKHSALESMFFRGIGLKLQFQDSCVAEQVMLHFARRGIAILPVHDSFICQQQHREELEAVMVKSFEEQFGVRAQIKLETEED